MKKKVDFIPSQWEDYKIFFDSCTKNLTLNDFTLAKFLAGRYFYFYINPHTLRLYNICPSITSILNITEDKIPKYISEFIDYIHPDDFEFIEFAENWGFEKIIASKNIDNYKIVYFLRFKVDKDKYEFFHHQTYYELNSETKKICSCISFNTRFRGLVKKSAYIVKLLDINNMEVVDQVTFYPSTNPLLKLLTVREKEIIVYIMRGLSGKEISSKLFISYNTIRTHHRNINRKLGVKNSAELIKKCE